MKKRYARHCEVLPYRRVSVEVVMPVYNEEAALPRSIPVLCDYLATYFPYRWSVVIADNASTDGTLTVARRLAAEDPRVSVLRLEEKGRGRALKAAWSASEADVVAYMDVDLSTNLWSFLPLVAPLTTGHSDVAIGSRLLKGAMVTRRWKREAISRCYNLLIKLLFRNGFSDAQCGFKAIRRGAARTLLPLVEDDGWLVLRHGAVAPGGGAGTADLRGSGRLDRGPRQPGRDLAHRPGRRQGAAAGAGPAPPPARSPPCPSSGFRSISCPFSTGSDEPIGESSHTQGRGAVLMHDARKVARLLPRREFLALLGAGAVVVTLGGCQAGRNTLADTAARKAAEVPDDEAVAKIAALVGPSVVQVNVKAIQTSPFGSRDPAAPVPFGPRDQEGSGNGQGEEGVGSGVVYREDGHIITNDHVVENADEVNVAFADGSTERGEVVATDPSTDLAVVRVDRRNLPAARFGDSRKLVVGQLAVAIGSPSGFQSTVTSGVISGLGREVPAEYTGGRQDASLVGLIQTDAAISPGNSGGALANRDGEVIGINVAYLPAETGAESIAFAIPSDTAVSVADQLIENGEAVHPYLGASLVDLTPETAQRFGVQVESGAVVVEVDPDGPAARAGISSEDVITAVGSTTVTSSGDVLATLRDHAPGDSVRLTILRSGGELRIEVRLGERGNAPTS